MAIVMKCNDNFQKRANDCSFPTSWNYQFTCWIKEDCSVVNPTMIIDRVAFDTWLSENPGRGRPVYCQIEDYGRYYFVRDFRYNKSVIEIDLECDVLATYREGITSERQFVLRSASTYNKDIQDTMYPAMANPDLFGAEFATPWVKQFNDGCVCFGVVGSGATNYYIMDYSEFSTFVQYLLSDAYSAAVIGAMALSAYPQYKLVVDPLQYISSLIWLPLPFLDVTTQTTPFTICTHVNAIKVGYVNVNCSAYVVNNACYRHIISAGTNAGQGAYTLYTHPDASTRGAYLNCSPWTQFQIYYPPFGLIDIDTVQLGLFQADSTHGVWLQLTTEIDVRTGTATLTIYRFRTNPNSQPDQSQVLTSINSQLGVVFEIGQVINPGYGVSSAIMFGADIVKDLAGIAQAAQNQSGTQMATAFAGGAQTIVTGVGDILRSKIPMARSIGGTGGVDAIMESPRFVYQFYHPSPEARAEIGRVLAEEKVIGDLQGYILCREGHTHFGRTLEEKQKIEYFLNTGFFNGDFNP